MNIILGVKAVEYLLSSSSHPRRGRSPEIFEGCAGESLLIGVAQALWLPSSLSAHLPGQGKWEEKAGCWPQSTGLCGRGD